MLAGTRIAPLDLTMDDSSDDEARGVDEEESKASHIREIDGKDKVLVRVHDDQDTKGYLIPRSLYKDDYAVVLENLMRMTHDLSGRAREAWHHHLRAIRLKANIQEVNLSRPFFCSDLSMDFATMLEPKGQKSSPNLEDNLERNRVNASGKVVLHVDDGMKVESWAIDPKLLTQLEIISLPKLKEAVQNRNAEVLVDQLRDQLNDTNLEQRGSIIQLEFMDVVERSLLTMYAPVY